mgnify:CR=1 FL=1
MALPEVQRIFFLVDEAHNLVDRARDMYSAVLIKEDVLETKRLLKTKSKKITASLESVNRALLDLKRQCDELLICTLSMTDALLGRLLRLQSVMDEFLQDPSFSEKNYRRNNLANYWIFTLTSVPL